MFFLSFRYRYAGDHKTGRPFDVPIIGDETGIDDEPNLDEDGDPSVWARDIETYGNFVAQLQKEIYRRHRRRQNATRDKCLAQGYVGLPGQNQYPSAVMQQLSVNIDSLEAQLAQEQGRIVNERQFEKMRGKRKLRSVANIYYEHDVLF